MINNFSTEVLNQLKYYVYRLIDPRDGVTFYVGKGKGNRVFEHLNCAIRENQEDVKKSLKLSRIREIQDKGLEVIHIIQRWGLEENEAIEVEAALIDIFALENLTNEVKGHHSNRGACNAEVLQNVLSVEEFVENALMPKFMIIKVKQWALNRNDNDRYQTTRSAWKVSPTKVKNYPYVLSVTDSIVREVYKVEKWELNPARNRYEFVGEVAPEMIRKLFINKKIPKCYRTKGQANPVLYCN